MSAAVALLPTKLTATEHVDECHLHAANLAMSMQAKYGGDWRASIDPENGFVVIVREG